MPEHPPTPILFVHHRNELGGAPTSLSYVIRALDRTRFEPHVYCPPGDAATLFREAGATVHEGAVAGFTHIWASTYRGRRWLLFGRELLRLPSHVVHLRSVLRMGHFGLVHLNDSPLIPAAWLARRAGIPVVWHLRSALPGGGSDLRSRLIRRAIRRLASASIAINSDIAAVFDVGSSVVPNSVDIERFTPGSVRDGKLALGLPPDLPVVAYFGFIYPSKGFREFIQAAGLLRDSGVHATYLIVGGAVRGERFFTTPIGRVLKLLDLARNYDAESRQLVKDLGLEDRLRFIPFTRRTDELYRASDIVVAPSRGPEIGRPVIEAASSGVPVVATGTSTGGGIIAPGETGVIVESWEAQTLADAIAGLMQDDERRRGIGSAARLHAERHFEPSRNTRAVESIYSRILGTGGRTLILFVHHRRELGGAPSSLAHLIRRLDRRFEPHVFVPEGPAAHLLAEAGAIVHTGRVSIFAHAWDNPYKGLRWLVLGREAVFLPSHIRELRRLVAQYRFPIVHLNDSPLLPAAWVAHRSGARVVWHLRSALAGEGRDRRSRAITALMSRWGDAAIAIDRDVAERFRVRFPTTIVHNSVGFPSDSIPGELAKRNLGLPLDRVAVGFAGFVRRQKGWPELVHAARALVTDGIPVHFVIMGGGVRPPAYFRTLIGRTLALGSVLSDEESAIKELVATLGLDGHFSFLPFTPDTDEIYAALDIVTFPNQGVGLGRPVLEAAAHGKPVVASGSRDGAGILLPNRTGILLDRAGPAEIADALRTLVADPAWCRRLGAAAARHAAERFDPERNAGMVEAVYDSLLGVPEPAEREESPLPVAAERR